jgi:hypothetical protein
MYFIGKTWQKLKKIVKRVQDLPKKMPKVEMPVNFKFAVNVSGQSSGLS